MNVLVDVVALAAIAFIVGWFWLYRPRAQPLPEAIAGTPIDVVVADGVYTPAEITVPVGRDTVLRFLRRDRSPCAATVLIDDLGVSAELPVDVPVALTVRPEAPGRHEFTCQMRMYRGVLIATEETS